MCPLVTTSLLEQQQAGAAPITVYPTMPNISKNWKWSDILNRDVLNPTGALSLYTTGGTDTPVFAMEAQTRLAMTTDGTIGDDAFCQLTEMALSRNADSMAFVDTRTILTVNFIFQLNQTTDVECFVGLFPTPTPTALPIQAERFFGIKFDKSASDNWFWTSSDGTTIVNTDTNVLAESDPMRIQLTWFSDTQVTMQLFSTVGEFPLDTLESTIEVTSLGTTQERYIPTFFIQTEANLAKTMRYRAMVISAS